MSHVFISYNRHDKAHLERLIAWLTEKGFAQDEIWYDQHIEGGNNWRDEIAVALDEAFAVLVIVTENSVKSLYCTYEWAYAMGQGILTLPLAFDNVSIADIPTPLTSKQFTDCSDHIPEYLQEQINRVKSDPPHVVAINKLVYEAIYDTHRRFFILGWLGGGFYSFDEEFREHIVDYFIEEAAEALHTLEVLMTDKAFAFSGKQYRLCWQLINLLKEFVRLQRTGADYLQEKLFLQFESVWLPAFEYFEVNKRFRWNRWIRRYFDHSLEDERTRLNVFAELFRAFPMLQAGHVETVIHNIRLRQENERK